MVALPRPVASFWSMVDGAASTPLARGGRDRIVFLGHATVLIELDGVRLLTDPLLRARVANLRRQVPPVDQRLAADADAVLISHLHRDHLDLASLRLLGNDRPLLVPAGAGPWLRRRGFTSVRELAVGDVASVGPLAVMAVEARHDGRRQPGGMRAQTLGYLVQGHSVIYFAGDTEYFEEMAKLAPGLDVALLPVAGWAPRLGPGHMNSTQAANAACLLEPRVAIPIHWGTLLPIGIANRHRSQLGEPPRRFSEQVARLAPSVEVRVLAPGEETTLNP
jgi:L-ascorbate metabolism protein UlaG (beta-lactamase superfamily)